MRPCYYLLLLYICVAMRGALMDVEARSNHTTNYTLSPLEPD